MIDISPHSDCICQQRENKLKECLDQYTIREQGKTVKLTPKNPRENVLAIIVDGCVISDNDKKCDALFLYKTHNKKYSFLVELKGARDIKKAFLQLSYTKG